MKAKQFLSPLFLLAFLFSCGPSANKDDVQQVNGNDTTVQEGPSALLAKFKTEKVLPFAADTSLLFHLEAGDSLGSNEVRQLTVLWPAAEILKLNEWELREFYIIDSVKTSGNYAAWCDSLTLGNTKRANAFSLEKIRLDSNTLVLLWGLSESSYEACPYSSFEKVLGTLVYKGAVSDFFVLGEYFSAGDPPVSMQRTISGKINTDSSIEVDVYQENDEDMDQPQIEVTRENYKFNIREGKIILLSEKKETPVMVKRKAD